jgi:hypothetical protein
MNEPTDRVVGRTASWANATLAVALGATLVIVGWPRVQHALGITPTAPAPAYRTGDRIDVPVEWYQASPFTLVLFARASCGACQQAQPYLQQLIAGMREHGAVVLASPGLEKDADLSFGRQLGLEDGQSRIVPTGLRVKATPTLVLVNRRGEILGAWEGVGPPAKQAAIRKAIGAALGFSFGN